MRALLFPVNACMLLASQIRRDISCEGTGNAVSARTQYLF
jgi:hypothetical protein